ncbi:hypothetical protein [Microbacterium terricola]|uniref:Tat pathway signal sequence domain protein n=1 Tax=Microbacterium terricola TaxID=344163 RepID=A0ABM8DVW1_9MICO|nr:hypothetical protein [Microbacterium terricola]UYK39506.1 hypothetical protein OAU46_12475 [Microbacterium terricola]BDV29761.1 hypothetical protein Microterr_04210 [Microbacterium terricola]
MPEQRVERFVAPTDERRPALSRRQILQAGVWAAPVLVLATAAPAAAASQSIPWEFASSSLAWTFGSNGLPNGVSSTAAVRTSPTATGALSGVTLTAVFRKSQIGSTPPDPTSLTGAGWTYVSKSVGTDTVTYTFLYAPSIGKGATSNVLGYQLAVGSSIVSQPIVEVAYTANASKATPVSVSTRAVTPATASGVSFWSFNTGTLGGSSRQNTYLALQMQVGTQYSNLWPVTQMPVTFTTEVILPAAYIVDTDPTGVTQNTDWRYVSRRTEGSNIILTFAFVKSDKTTPRPLQATNANGVAQVADRVTDTGSVNFHVRLSSAASGKPVSVNFVATPIQPFPADGKSISASRTFN